MMKKTLKNSSEFNPYPYHDKAVCNQFVFAIEGHHYLSSHKELICRIVPKSLWDKKKQYFTEEINLSIYLGSDSNDTNGTGSWTLPSFSHDPLECAKQLVEKGFIWDKNLQLAVNKNPSDDVLSWDSSQFEVSPNANLATEIHKPMTLEIELEIFENRLGVHKVGIQNALLNFFRVFRTVPITKESVLISFLKKYQIPWSAAIERDCLNDIPSSACWLDKSQLLHYYIQSIPKEFVNHQGACLLEVAQEFKSKKSEAILLANGFKKFTSIYQPST